MPATVLVVQPEASLAERISHVLDRQGFQVSWVNDARSAVEQMALRRPDLLILAHELPDANSLQLVVRLRNIPRTATVLVVVIMPGNYLDVKLNALDAGADAVLAQPLDERELIITVRSLIARVERMRQYMPSREPGKIITFFSAKGGVGTTSICVNTAASLAKLNSKARIICVDLVLPLGSVSDVIGIPANETIATLSAFESAQLDQFTVSGFLATRSDLGFEALLGARDPAEAQRVNPDNMEPIMRHLQNLGEYIFVDIGRSISRISLPVLKISHQVVIILAADLASLRLSKVAVNYFKTLGLSDRRIVLVLNRIVEGDGASNDEIQEIIRHPLITTVPYAADRFTTALNAGVPLVLAEPNSAAAGSLRDLAQHLMQP